jgi:type IV pilus assembly protein PilW
VNIVYRPLSRPRGFSLIEMLVALTLGLLLLLGLTLYFVGSSRNYSENERVSRQLENGRYAMHVLSEDIRHAGFYGATGWLGTPSAGALPDPCSTALETIVAALPVALHGVDFVPGTSDPSGSVPGCVPDHLAGTDILVIRRARTTTIPAGSAVSGGYYTQTSSCSTETPAWKLATTAFTLTLADCVTAAPLRQFYTFIYYVSPCARGTGTGGACSNSDPPLPTLKRVELGPSGFSVTPLVEGIENLQLEFGLDTDATPDGGPNDFTASPAATGTAWASVVAVRVHLLARNVDATPSHTDTKTYRLGTNADGSANDVTPGGGYKRHAFTGLVRVVNVSQRRERIYGAS